MVFWLADVPGEQVGDAVDGVGGYAGEHVAEPGFRVEAVELGGFDQGVEARGAFAAGVGAGEEIVLSPEGERPICRSAALLSGMYRLGAADDRDRSRQACMLLADREQGASGARIAGRPN